MGKDFGVERWHAAEQAAREAIPEWVPKEPRGPFEGLVDRVAGAIDRVMEERDAALADLARAEAVQAKED